MKQPRPPVFDGFQEIGSAVAILNIGTVHHAGGPLLDSYGNVMGVVTSKLDALAALAATGDIPQTVNFALRRASLYAFQETQRLRKLLAEKLRAENADLRGRLNLG